MNFFKPIHFFHIINNRIFLSFLFLLLPLLGHTQTIIKGTVLQKSTLEPLPFISVTLKGTQYGTNTDIDGKFTLSTSQPKGTLLFSFLGFKPTSAPYNGSETITVLMQEEPTLIEVSVSRKAKYRNKDNPAVELIRQVIDHKNENKQRNTPFLKYDEYEKIKLSLINPDKSITDNFLLKKYQFMMENVDSVTFPGSPLWPFYLEEKLYTKYFRKNPDKDKTFIKGRKRIEFDSRFINNDAISTAMGYLYQDIDIYKSNIYILTKSFLSPIADLSPGFYKFFIKDTTVIDGSKIVELVFVPRNTADLLFSGNLFVSLDNYAVTGAEMHINKNTAINWVDEMKIDLAFQKGKDSRYYLEKSYMGVDFSIVGSKQTMYGERRLFFNNYDLDNEINDTIFSGPSVELVLEDEEKNEIYLQKNRPIKLDRFEAKTYTNYDSLNNMNSFNRLLQWGAFLLGGYLNVGKFEIGYYGSFISSNEVEGLKLRIAGRTTEEFNKRIYLSGNLGYSFKDERWKHYAAAAYAFNKKSIFSYPQHFIQVSHTFDSRTPGLNIQFDEEENPLLSFKRGTNDKFFYDDIYQVSYVIDATNNFRVEALAKKWKQEPIGSLNFINQINGDKDTLNYITSTEVGMLIRWAPNERRFDKKRIRKSLPSRYPIITARFNVGIPGLIDGQYGYQKLEVKLTKRFILSQLGHADVELNGGNLWGTVPYPYLFIPKANQSYLFMRYSYNLMNFMEFISDRFVDLKIDYHMDGFLFNKIPLFKKLRLREVASLKAIYGSLRDENNPQYNKSAFELPKYENGLNSTFMFKKAPYVEVSVGIENILNIFRIDYVWRTNYLNHPGVSSSGIRFGGRVSL